MFRRHSHAARFSAIRQLMHDSSVVRAMSILHPLALHDGEGGAGGGGGDGGKGGQGSGDGGTGTKTGVNDLPPEQQIGALTGKNRELLGKLAKHKPFTDFAKSVGITDVSKVTPAKLERLKAAWEAEDDDAGTPHGGDTKGGTKGKGADDARIKALQDGHAKELEKLNADKGKLTTALDKALRQNARTNAIQEHDGRPALLNPVVDAHVKLQPDEDTGDYAVVVVDDKGEVRYGKNGDPMTVSEFVAELKADPKYAGAFNAPRAAGSGSQGAGGSKAGVGGAGVLTLTSAEARNTATYRAARDRAQKEGLELKIVD